MSFFQVSGTNKEDTLKISLAPSSQIRKTAYSSYKTIYILNLRKYKLVIRNVTFENFVGGVGGDLALAIPSCATATTIKENFSIWHQKATDSTYESPHLQDALPQASLTGVWVIYIMSGIALVDDRWQKEETLTEIMVDWRSKKGFCIGVIVGWQETSLWVTYLVRVNWTPFYIFSKNLLSAVCFVRWRHLPRPQIFF